MAVTERLILPVKGDTESWKEQLKAMLQTLKTQDGYIRTRWGPHSENQQVLELLIGWESIGAQKKFEASPDFAKVMSELKPVLSGTPEVYFIEFKPYAPKEVIDSTFVQMITLSNLPAEATEEAMKSKLEEHKAAEGCNGATSGWSTSEVAGKGRVFVIAIGWDSWEASQKARDANPPPANGAVVEAHHVNFRFPVKGFRGL